MTKRTLTLALIAAGSAVAKKLKAIKIKETVKQRSSREGKSFPVDLAVRGSIAGNEVNIPIKGVLAIGLMSPEGATKRPDTVLLLAQAIDLIPKTKRESFLAQKKLTDKATADGKLGAAKLIERLSTKASRAGAASFRANEKK